jgi:membrane protein required for colicin V production
MIGKLDAFDWIMTMIVGMSMAVAFRRGLVRAIFGLLGLIGGFQLASDTYVEVADRINFYHGIQSETTVRIIAFLLVATVVALGFEFVGRGMQKSLRLVGLGIFDRVLGAVFGFARGCLICIALLMVLCDVAPQSELLVRSALSPYLFAAAHDVSFLVPQYLQQEMVDGAFDFKQGPPHWINRH